MEGSIPQENLTLIFKNQQIHSEKLRTRPISDRRTKLKQLLTWVLNHRNDIQNALANDLKKSKDEADISEILVIATELRHVIRNLKNWSKPQKIHSGMLYLGTSTHVYLEPKGVCLIISPWNYPFLLTVGPMISAIAAGNTVIIKPSEYASETSLLIKTMVTDVFNPEECMVMMGGPETSLQLLNLPFDHIFFTGSPRIGKIVMEHAAKHLASVTLELGGKSPCVVTEDADIVSAAKRIAWGKWLNGGQTCVAPDYVWVHRSIKEAFLSHLTFYAQHFYGNEMTGMIHDQHLQKMKKWKGALPSQSESIRVDGDIDEKKRTIKPIIVTEEPSDHPMWNEEIFGPILPVTSFDDMNEALNFIRQHPKPLSAYLFTKSATIRQQFINEISAGSVVINDCVLQFGHPNMPFGGVGNSGIGKSHGKYGFVAFSNEKPVLRQQFRWSISQMIYPPYNSLKKKIIDIAIKYL